MSWLILTSLTAVGERDAGMVWLILTLPTAGTTYNTAV